ncbi:MAG TPA: hypothetical protein DCE47_12205 [Planctomycetaceae bacterium]|nr:hypothetical protein [Planctomycetaceae bacterium]
MENRFKLPAVDLDGSACTVTQIEWYLERKRTLWRDLPAGVVFNEARPFTRFPESSMIRRIVPLLLPLVMTLAALPANAADRIAWYSTLKQGLAVAKATGRPILLVSAAPHCHGISGIW